MKKRKLVSLVLGGISCCFMSLQSVSALKLVNALKVVFSVQRALDTWRNGNAFKLNNVQKDLIYYHMIYRLSEGSEKVQNQDGKEVSAASFTANAVKGEIARNQELHPLDAFFKLASKNPEQFSDSDEAISEIMLAAWKYDTPRAAKLAMAEAVFKEDYLPAAMAILNSDRPQSAKHAFRGNTLRFLLGSVDWQLVRSIKNELISSQKTADEMDIDYIYDLFGCVPIIFNKRGVFESFKNKNMPTTYKPNSGDFFVDRAFYSSFNDYESMLKSLRQYSKNQGFTENKEKSQIILPAFVRPLADADKNNSDYVNDYAFFKGSNSLDVCKHNLDLTPGQELARQIIIWGYYMQKNNFGIPGNTKVSAYDIKAYADSLKRGGSLGYDHFRFGRKSLGLSKIGSSKIDLFKAIVQFLHNNHLNAKDDYHLEIEPRIYSPQNMKLPDKEFRKIYKRMLGEKAKYGFYTNEGFVAGVRRINTTGEMDTFNRKCALGYASFFMDHDESEYDLHEINVLANTALKNLSDKEIELTDEVINKYLAGQDTLGGKWTPNAGLVEYLSDVIVNTQWTEDNFEITPFSDYASEKASSLGDLLKKCESMSPEVFGKIICYLHNPDTEDKTRLTDEIVKAMGDNSKQYVNNLLKTLDNVSLQDVPAHFADYMVFMRFLEVFKNKISTLLNSMISIQEQTNFIFDNFVTEPAKKKIESLISPHYEGELKGTPVNQDNEINPLTAFIAEILKNISPKESQNSQNNNNDDDNQNLAPPWSRYWGPVPQNPSEKTTLLSELYSDKDTYPMTILGANARNDILGITKESVGSKNICKMDDFPLAQSFFDKFFERDETANFVKTYFKANDFGWYHHSKKDQDKWLKDYAGSTSPLFEEVYRQLIKRTSTTSTDDGNDKSDKKALDTPDVCLEVNAGEILSQENFLNTLWNLHKEHFIKDIYRNFGNEAGLKLNQVEPVIDKTGEIMSDITEKLPEECRRVYERQLSIAEKEVFKFLSREDIRKFTFNGLWSGLKKDKRYAFEPVSIDEDQDSKTGDNQNNQDNQNSKNELISITSKMLDENGKKTLDPRKRYITVPDIITLNLGSEKYKFEFREVEDKPTVNKADFEIIMKKPQKQERKWFDKAVSRRLEISELCLRSAKFLIRRYLNDLNPAIKYKVQIKILNKTRSKYQDYRLTAEHIFGIGRQLGFTKVENYNPETDRGKVCYVEDQYVIFRVPKAIDDKK